MDEKNYRFSQYEKRQDDHNKRLRDLEKFKHSTVEQLKTIFNRLKDLEQSSKWVSQSFFYLILSGVIGAVFSAIGWFVTR